MHVEVFGLEDAKEWSKIFEKPNEKFDIEKVEQEIVDTAQRAISKNGTIGAFVLECTDLPPFAAKISEATKLPVFDFVTMIGQVALALGEMRMY